MARNFRHKRILSVKNRYTKIPVKKIQEGIKKSRGKEMNLIDFFTKQFWFCGNCLKAKKTEKEIDNHMKECLKEKKSK